IMTPETLWELGRVSAEGLSPDGRWLVYGVSNYTFKENKSEKNLFVMPTQGGKPIQLTQKEGGESVVQITEQGEVIYVYQGQLWSQPLAGGEAKQLTDIAGGLENVKLSPDSKHILFSRAVLIYNNNSTVIYSVLPKSEVYIYDDLVYLLLDTFNEGGINCTFNASSVHGRIRDPIKDLEDLPFDSPQAFF